MMIENILCWFTLDNIGKLFIDKKYVDYINPFLHGSLLSIYSIKEIYFKHNSEQGFNNEQLTIINLSTGYFIYDIIKMALIRKYWNNLYVAHHLALLYFFHFFKKYDLKDFFIESLFFGELTNPILQIWHMSKTTNNKVLFRYTNHIFTAMFLLFRCILMPIFFYKKINLLPNLNISKFDYNTVFGFSIIFNMGNIAWSYQLIKGYLKWLKKNH